MHGTHTTTTQHYQAVVSELKEQLVLADAAAEMHLKRLKMIPLSCKSLTSSTKESRQRPCTASPTSPHSPSASSALNATISTLQIQLSVKDAKLKAHTRAMQTLSASHKTTLATHLSELRQELEHTKAQWRVYSQVKQKDLESRLATELYDNKKLRGRISTLTQELKEICVGRDGLQHQSIVG